VPSNYEELPWQQEAGPTVFTPFPETTDYFGPDAKAWMVDFLVRSLDAMVTQLPPPASPSKLNGRFASLYDPEGNPIGLWQPENL
jgi:glyoxylase I family protein